MKTSDFDFYLPKELIAQTPPEKRDESRLMVVERTSGIFSHRDFHNIIEYLEEGDLLVVNDTKVIPARIFTSAEDKKKREILLIKEIAPFTWETFVKPQRGLNIGDSLTFADDGLTAKVNERTPGGTYILFFSKQPPLDKIGFAPLPPYIKRDYTKPDLHDYDKERYQTVYANSPGAIAAPTAGLHFTPELLEKIKTKGIKTASITLHVGIGTFRPVRADDVEDHTMLPEWFSIPEETTNLIKTAKRVIAVGTTTVRTLETSIEGSGYTNKFIYPPHEFKVVDALITNFHLPKSTLLMLISAFAGRELIMKAYKKAIETGYKFYSYGDAMLIL